MNDISAKDIEAIRGSPGNEIQGDRRPLALNPDEYREDLDEFDLTREQQDELLGILWNIMRTFVEIGFGLDSVQMFSTRESESSEEKAGRDSGNALTNRNTPHQRNRAAFDRAAQRGEREEECPKE